MQKTIVSIILSVYNSADCLNEALESIRQQLYEHVQLIVIDGGSTDGSLDIIQRYMDIIDYWSSEPDQGIYDAWNKGLNVATGEWIVFIGADDTLKPDALSNYMAHISRLPKQPDYISSRIQLSNANGALLRKIGQQWHWKTFQRYMNVAHGGSLHHKTLFQRYGKFDTSYRACGDYEFLLRPQNKLLASFMNAITINMRTGGISDNAGLALQEAKRAKIETGGRSKLLANIDYQIAKTKFKIRKILAND